MNGVLLAILFLFLPASSVADDLFDIKPVADGVYAAIAKPTYKVNCNAAIIFLDDVVLVVDTHSKPSAARALIEQIKKLTPKPVKFVVNTHFHWDHYQGNEAYPSSWPAGVEIISSEATRTSIEQRGIRSVQARRRNERRRLVSFPQPEETRGRTSGAAGESVRGTPMNGRGGKRVRRLFYLRRFARINVRSDTRKR